MKDKNSIIYSIWSIVRLLIITVLLMGVINVIPFTEEMFHRGYFMGNTFRRLSYWKRNVLSAFLFSLSHWMGSGYGSIFMFIFAMAISTFLFGFVFNNLRMITGSIWMGFSLHWFFNFIYTCIFLNTENYNIATLTVFLLLGACAVVTSRWVQKLIRTK